jgi:4a-hydroxytetrahydrobiopterin dehydratase
MTRLDDAARAEFLAEHPDWELVDESISRTYRFRDFSEAMAFVTRVGLASEVADHHPDIDIRWNRVKLVLSTHSEGALTRKDTDLAALFDEFGAGR